MRTKKKNHEYEKITKLDVAVVLLVVAICLTFLVPAGRHFLEMSQSRVVLKHAKAVCLATQVISYEYLSQGESILSSETDSRLREEAKDSILNLAQTSGELYLVSFNTTSTRVNQMVYVEGKYVVTYELDGDKSKWNVDRLERKISNE